MRYFVSSAKKYLLSQDWHSHKMAAKMVTMFGDVTDLQQRHHP